MELILFCILSLPLLALSWRSLFSLKNHGFFRFIVWECILWLCVANHRHLIVREFDFQRILSSILMLSSLLLVLSAVFVMHTKGMASSRRKDATLFGFEKTTELVESGVFGIIRHPMYVSLFFLSWGILLRNAQVSLMIVAVVSSIACVIAAYIEENENQNYFGDKYEHYKSRTKMFIPYII